MMVSLLTIIFYTVVSDKKSGDNGEAAQTFMDMLLFENQIPFFVLFELHKLKQDKDDDAKLLMELIELVKNCYESQVRKLTQPLLPCKYTPEKLPKHLLEVVHSLCVPTRSVPTRSDEGCTGQIHTATGLEKYGVRFNNTGELHSLFDMDINWCTMKIRCFRIDDFTETFLRNMIAYEEQSDFASKYFTDFVLIMSHLIKTPEDANLLCDLVQLFSQLIVKDNTSSLSTLSTLSGVIKKQEVPEENQTHNIGKYISRVPEALSKTNPSAYKPKLISIGPYYRIQEPGSENSIKRYFQEGFFGNTEGLEERCQVLLTSFVDKARSCYACSTKNISDVRLVEMLMGDGCFILQFLKSVKDKKSSDNGKEAQTFMEKERKVAQTLNDMLLLENQIPFFVLFELHKLKQDKGDDVALLKELIELVKNCYGSQVRKLTQPLLPNKYKPQSLPKHLLEVVHSLCIPTNTTRSDEYDEEYGVVLQQINTATELKNVGVSFQKIEEVDRSLFGIDFNWWGTMKIRCFRIDDFTETFLRNMIAYEQHSDLVAFKYFTDFVLFMSHLIHTPEDAKLLCGKGIIANFKTTDDKEKVFSQLLVGVDTSSTSTLSTLSGVINKVSQHCEKPLKILIGMSRQYLTDSPLAPILSIVAVIAALVTVVHYIKS
nr:UPF0481 protein At3g47200-like [Ipomoea batatas]